MRIVLPYFDGYRDVSAMWVGDNETKCAACRDEFVEVVCPLIEVFNKVLATYTVAA